MLMANIIYLPGTGGTFLRRALSLSDRAIMSEPDSWPSAKVKFDFYKEWDLSNWTSKEILYRPRYRDGESEFYLYEQSTGYLIDAWHPVEFLTHDSNNLVWETGAWPYLIFINATDQYREFLEANQYTKQYRLDWDQEHRAMSQLQETYRDKKIEIDFDDLLDRDRFVAASSKINLEMALDLDMLLVEKLWEDWYHKSQIVWKK